MFAILGRPFDKTMSTTLERIDALVAHAPQLAAWTGPFDRESLLEWLRMELGDDRILDDWVKRGLVISKAVVFSPVLHVVSGNTLHAAFQSVLRGLLVGCVNRVKLPSAGLPEFEQWVRKLPPILSELIEISHSLPEEWLACEAAVIFGGGDTIETFRGKLSPAVRRIEHGPKLGIAVVFEPTLEAAQRIAEDILRHDQRGCLSVQAVYVEGEATTIHAFGDMLAKSMTAYRERNPETSSTLSDAGGVSNAREIARFLMANGEPVRLWESKEATDWTIIYDGSPVLKAGPLNGFVRLHPLPSDLRALGDEVAFISGAAIHPFSQEHASKLDALDIARICEAGKAQEPTIFWHHDGMSSLASLVRWRDLG